MWTRRELKSNAKVILKKVYWQAVLAAFIVVLLMGASYILTGDEDEKAKILLSAFLPAFIMKIVSFFAFSRLVRIAISLLLKNPLLIGCCKVFINCRNGEANLDDLTIAFKEGYLNVVFVEFLRALFNSLWCLLLIIPGIVKHYEYMMIPYLMAENPQMSGKEAFAASKRMMTGNQWKAFVLDLSFTGWWLLGECTGGILNIFYIEPYIGLTKAELYHTLKAQQMK